MKKKETKHTMFIYLNCRENPLFLFFLFYIFSYFVRHLLMFWYAHDGHLMFNRCVHQCRIMNALCINYIRT